LGCGAEALDHQIQRQLGKKGTPRFTIAQIKKTTEDA
jgi:hypothetical protein